MAKGFDKKGLRLLKKKNMRLIDISQFKDDNSLSIRTFCSSFLQEKDNKVYDYKKLKFVTKIKPT